MLDEEIHRVILEGADATVLHAAARKQGMITLYEDGLRKVVQGVTSMQEVLRVTQDQGEVPQLAAEEDIPESSHVA
jgi:general secretion pathway protein E